MNRSISLKKKFSIINFLTEIKNSDLAMEIYLGLIARHKYISPKFFYDERGSILFEKITSLKEYYPTRYEKRLLKDNLKALEIDFNNLDIIELGSGDASKISLIFEQLSSKVRQSINYFPVDISVSAIEHSIEMLLRFNLKNITGIALDFTKQLSKIPANRKRLFCFFGSTIGNYSPSERFIFIKNLSKQMKKGDELLIGMDMVKDKKYLEAAYNDSLRITEMFNKNILNVINKITEADFPRDNFQHKAFYNEDEQRIEMHLIAKNKLSVNLNKFSKKISIDKGESIHTENSYKFRFKDISDLGEQAGLSIHNIISDQNQWYSLIHYVKK